jgi:O-glycosyl hydrolase
MRSQRSLGISEQQRCLGDLHHQSSRRRHANLLARARRLHVRAVGQSLRPDRWRIHLLHHRRIDAHQQVDTLRAGDAHCRYCNHHHQCNCYCAAGDANSAVASGTYTLNGPAVSVVLSTNDQTSLMAAQPAINFGLGSTADATTNTVVVDPTQTYQSIEGFGAAFTDSAADLLINVEPAASLPGTLNDLFTTNGDGIGLSFMRIPMGGSDIALSVYSYDDQPVGTTDLNLTNFSIAHDQAYILPLIKQAKALNPQMKLMANPWSPPGWMKDPASMSPVSMLGGTLLMTPANETAFANYFVKFLQAYQAAGVPIDYISLQNEPLNITTSYPSMGMSDTVQLDLLQGYVLPAFTANNITTKIFAYDHNWDTPSYPQTVLGGLTPQQLTQMAGTAWHGYGGAPGAQQLLQNQFPALGNWETEHSGGTWQADQFTVDILEITQVLRNSGKSFVKWSLALNEKLGPNLTQNAGLGGCNTCTPIVTVNSTTGAVTKDYRVLHPRPLQQVCIAGRGARLLQQHAQHRQRRLPEPRRLLGADRVQRHCLKPDLPGAVGQPVVPLHAARRIHRNLYLVGYRDRQHPSGHSQIADSGLQLQQRVGPRNRADRRQYRRIRSGLPVAGRLRRLRERRLRQLLSARSMCARPVVAAAEPPPSTSTT